MAGRSHAPMGAHVHLALRNLPQRIEKFRRRWSGASSFMTDERVSALHPSYQRVRDRCLHSHLLAAKLAQ